MHTGVGGEQIGLSFENENSIIYWNRQSPDFLRTQTTF